MDVSSLEQLREAVRPRTAAFAANDGATHSPAFSEDARFTVQASPSRAGWQGRHERDVKVPGRGRPARCSTLHGDGTSLALRRPRREDHRLACRTPLPALPKLPPRTR